MQVMIIVHLPQHATEDGAKTNISPDGRIYDDEEKAIS